VTLWQKYQRAEHLADALEKLKEASGEARLVAGGTDLLLDLQQGRCPPVHTLVDITNCAELNCLEVRGERLFIGAAVSLSRLIASALVWQHARAAWEACGLIAGPQVRNTATLGGNVAHALPAGDGSIALVALRAQAEIASLQGSREAPLESLFLGPGRTALIQGQEVLVGFYVPLVQPGEASAFQRVMRPQGVALPVLNMAIWLKRSGDLLADLTIAIGPAGAVPFRARQVEDFLLGKEPAAEVIKQAAATLVESVHFRSSPRRASSTYRQHLAQYLLHDALLKTWERVCNDR
jgi:xanthine dehydrogenase FAD-binding subunit